MSTFSLLLRRPLVIGAIIVVSMIILLVFAVGLFSKDSSQPLDATNSETVNQDSVQRSIPDNPDDPPVLKNLIVDFAPYDKKTNRAGAFLFIPGPSKIFYEFGATVMGPDGEKMLPTFEYQTANDASVFSAIDGVVTHIEYQEDTKDYAIFMSPRRGSKWTIEYDHVQNLEVKQDDLVTAGQRLGTAGTSRDSRLNRLGRVELMVMKEQEDRSALHHCPFTLFDPALLDEYKQKVSTLTQDWEGFKGNSTIYSEASEVYPGCYYKTLRERDGQVFVPEGA